MGKSLAEHLDPQGSPKRILSLDGGGIRGALTLGYLKKIETILRKKENNPELLLCDYFDLIGGTSTGSIIAAGLAVGYSVDQLVNFYLEVGGTIFGRRYHWWNPFEFMKYLKAGFDYSVFEETLKKTFGDITLGSDKIRTGLCIVAKRADTNSIWPMINHPKGKYYDAETSKNKNILLWQAIRASTAAPSYFAPQMIQVGDAQKAAFVDGGVSMANNPALTLLMVATLKGFPFHWEMGEDKLTIVSVGTGTSVFKRKVGEIERAWLGTWARSLPDMFMQDASFQNQTILQWLSNSPTAIKIDSEMGSLQGDSLCSKPLLKYLRYNFVFSESSLNSLGLGRKFSSEDVQSLVEMSNAQNRQILYDIGVAASDSILEEHFA